MTLALLVAAPALFAAIPAPVIASGPDLCLIKLLLGVECWGCGITRALHQLMLGDWRTALELHRGVFAVALALAAEWVRLLVQTMTTLPRRPESTSAFLPESR